MNPTLDTPTCGILAGPASVFERLAWQRIVVLGQELDDAIANQLCGQLLLLAAEDPAADISFYINSSGGSVSAGLAVFDTMEQLPCDVATYALGTAASMGQLLLTAGTPGKRHVLPHATVLMHQPTAGIGGQESDVVIHAERLRRVRRELAEITAARTGQSVERVFADSERDRWFTAAEAVEYGLADRVVGSIRT